jgi:hypothetical protein
MSADKDSKRSKTDKKKGLSTKKASKPAKTQGVQKVSKPKNADTKKRPAKRKANVIKAKRVQTQYDIVRGVVADYCKRNYGRRCTREESKQIYQALKLRFLDKDRKTNVTLEEIKTDIDKVLAFKDKSSPPDTATLPFTYFEVVSRLYDNDGGYFREDDTLIFDLTAIGEGKVKTPYAELPYAYKTDIYERVRGYVLDVKDEGITFSDNQLEFVYDADKSNEEKRIFVWKLSLDAVQDKEQQQTTKEIKEGKEEKERNIEYNKEKAAEEIQEIKEGIKEDSNALAIEQEKTKQKEIEKGIEEQKTRQKELDRQIKLMDLLEKGLITAEQFAQMMSLK